MLRRIAFFSVGLIVLGMGSSRADEAVLDQLYDSGVHAFFRGDYAGAYQSLTSAIQGGSQDPRPYYFRAFAEYRLGRQPDAQADLEKGAALEVADVNGRYFVGQALERIQGEPRMIVEQFRAQARTVAFQREQRKRQNVFDQQRSTEEVLLRHDIPATELTPPPAAAAPAAAPAATEPAPAPTAAAATPEAPADKPAEKPASKTPDADPFGADAGKNAADKPAEPPASKPAEKAPDNADPFGGDAKPSSKPADKPADKAAEAPLPPQPGAVKGVFRALTNAIPAGSDPAAGPAAAATPPAVAPPAAGAAAATPPKAAAPAADDSNPFGASPAAAATPPAANPVAPAAAATLPAKAGAGNPFGDDPGQDAKTPPASGKGAPAAPAADAGAKKDDDPFGSK